MVVLLPVNSEWSRDKLHALEKNGKDFKLHLSFIMFSVFIYKNDISIYMHGCLLISKAMVGRCGLPLFVIRIFLFQIRRENYQISIIRDLVKLTIVVLM